MLTGLSPRRGYVRSEYIGIVGCFLSAPLCGKWLNRHKGFRPVPLATNLSITLARGDYRLADSVTAIVTSSASGVIRIGRQLPRGRKPPLFNLRGTLPPIPKGVGFRV